MMKAQNMSANPTAVAWAGDLKFIAAARKHT